MALHVSIDVETFSACPLPEAGAYVYAAHPTTEILCLSWRSFDTETRERDHGQWRPGMTPPPWLLDPAAYDVTYHAWNVEFEQNILRHVLKVPVPDNEHWDDTMIRSAAIGLPRGLDTATKAIGLPESMQKDDRGKTLIHQLCKPYHHSKRMDGKYSGKDRADKMNELYAYCDQDVVAESSVAARIPPLSPAIRELWLVDREINDRGVPIDVDACADADVIYQKEQERLAAKLVAIARRYNDDIEATTGTRPSAELENPSSRAQVMTWLEAVDFTIPNLQAGTIRDLLAAEQPPVFQEFLQLYQWYKRSAATKYRALLNRTSSDGYIRGCFSIFGAHTGRWASIGINLQNIPRPTLKNPDDPDDDSYANDPIQYFWMQSPAALETIYDAPASDILAGCIRGMIAAKPGHRLLVADYSAIEARILAWLAGETALLRVFEKGGDVYVEQACTMFHKPTDRISKEDRLVGKVAILALGYGGGKGAFASMARLYGLDVTDSQAESYKVAYRNANKHIVGFWRAIERAYSMAVANPNTPYTTGEHELVFFRQRAENGPDVLEVTLPSGRQLHYWAPKLITGEYGGSNLSYLGVDQTTRRWRRHESWYGLIVENIVQAVAADVLMAALVRLSAHGYRVVSHVHDEIVCEMPLREGSLKEMVKLMTAREVWNKTLPLTAEGYEAERFRK